MIFAAGPDGPRSLRNRTSSCACVTASDSFTRNNSNSISDISTPPFNQRDIILDLMSQDTGMRKR